MNQQNSVKEYLSLKKEHFSSDNFKCFENITFGERAFRLIAKKSRFEIAKFGFSETFFVFEEFDSLNVDLFRKFSSAAFNYSLKNKNIPLPRGVFESVWCFPIAIVQNVDESVINSVKNNTPPRHWASAEMPVLFDIKNRTLSYFEKTPIWGALYYAGFRETITKMLMP